MTVTVTQADINTAGHYRVLRYKYVRDAGAAMAAAHVVKEPAAFAILTKIDGTTVDTRNEVPAGLTYSVSGESTSILIADALLGVNETVYMDVYVGPVLDQ